ncbi:unnamed protein product [Heligmosomoides polygyrus]|uniref:Calmodulin n=1 Tax=Heligmosomoides polygyrus TaxID=6339 RepID=A0A183F3N7_HELPZ|nr:unnamed protein product [Heligmosomoides polygyrus]
MDGWLELSETFDLLDIDKDGRLSRNEIAALLRAVKVEPTRVELDFIFKEMDAHKSGKIGKEEFVRYMRCPPVHRTTLDDLETHFREFDSDGDGAITEGACIFRHQNGLNLEIIAPSKKRK